MSLKPSKELIEKWYAKLKNEGFDDKEADEDTLKTWCNYDVHRSGARHDIQIEGIRDYYILAGQFYHDHKFLCKREKEIWYLHSEGHSCQTIEKMMKSRHFKVYKDLINKTIMRLRSRMLEHVRPQ